MSKHNTVDYALLRKRMVEDGLTNKQICERTGMSPSTVSKARRVIFHQLMAERAKAQVFESPMVRRQAT